MENTPSLWIAIQYNIDDNYWAKSLGIFSTKEKAILKVKECLNECGFDNDDEYGFPEPAGQCERLLEELRKTGDCQHIFGYIINRHQVDK